MAMIPFPMNSTGELLLNIHTHHPCAEGEQTVPAFGLHPWHVHEGWKLDDVVSKLPSAADAFYFIGECGLDCVYPVPYALQLAAFQAQIALSERLCRPLMLQCVRAQEDVIRLHQIATQPWVWHGFRGKPQQLQQLLHAGFYVSFGWKHNPESLKACPLDRLFLETDDGPAAIAPLYGQVAAELGISVAQLAAQTWANLHDMQTQE